MFGIGFGEMLVIGVLILIAVGPDKLPIMVKTVARTYRQFRRAATEIRSSTGLDDFLRDEELKELAELRKQKLSMMAQGKPAPMTGKPWQPPPKQGAPGKPTAPAKPMHGSPMEGVSADGAPEEEEGAPIPAAHTKPTAGLMLKQRIMETPPQGVDISEARAAEPTAIPPTRVSPATAPTESLPKAEKA